ncbi:hypothetical protein BDY19DRAFT_906540 [Irpex rosettiformis]|uniref:Uncharacterized protein n=1 Tax=Irpex rosettiformis TaxID=378272 RepID=A0ACB8U2V1_9APHY|nr:hypothetical protein BDY19DRAFT_906540 [Irpex rosettiformis]
MAIAELMPAVTLYSPQTYSVCTVLGQETAAEAACCREEELRAEVEAAKARAFAAEAAVAAADAQSSAEGNGEPRAPILKLTGCYSLQDAMGLAGDRIRYRAIQANNDHPILATYANNWATTELIKQFMQNQRKYAYQKEILPRPARCHAHN